MRIVGGSHRGRRLAVPGDRTIRPTSDRTREALFNILAHAGWGPGENPPLDGAQVLDAFCGTGALGLEALSRGAAHAVLMDTARASLDLAGRNVRLLGEEGRTTILRADARRPPRARGACALAFLDPPYGQGLAEPALGGLAGAGWFAPGAVVVVEIGEADPLDPSESFERLDERRYGDTRIAFLRYAPGDGQRPFGGR